MASTTNAKITAVNDAQAEKLAAARAEVDAIRARKQREAEAAAASTVFEHVTHVQPQRHAATLEELAEQGWVPSLSRIVVGFVLGLAGAGAVGYGIGMLMAYCLAGISALAGGAFITFTLSALVWILGIYASWKIGGWVGGKVFSSVVLPDGLASKCYGTVTGSVSGFFAKRPSVVNVQQQFTGAHTVPGAA